MKETQKIAVLPGEKECTGEYAESARNEFEGCLKKVFLEIARQAFERKDSDAAGFITAASECHDFYFRTMKGATNIKKETLERLVRKECDRQKRFYAKLARLQAHFNKINVPFKIQNVSFSEWDTGLTAGCNIYADNTSLFAFPLIPAKGPGKVLFIEEDCVIVLIKFPTAMRPFQSPAVWLQEFGIPKNNKVAVIVKEEGKQTVIHISRH